MANELKNTMIGNNIYILTNICAESCSDIIVNLSNWVQKNFGSDKKLEFTPDEDKAPPYSAIMLNVYISSRGGDTDIARAIINLFNIAKAQNNIVRTYNLSRADSSASMIAVSGTHGYRYMAHDATNLIHYGKYSLRTDRYDEQKYTMNYLDRENKYTKNVYLDNTKLNSKDLDKFFSTEGAGELTATQCLSKGVCDWVITPNGWVNNVKDLQQKTR